MTGYRAAKILIAVALVPAMMGADGGCGKETSNRPPTDKQPPKHPCIVTAQVTEASGPYDLELRAERVGLGLGNYRHDHAIARGWKKTIVYECGDKVEVKLHVKGHPEDRFGCLIDDGIRNRDRRYGKKAVLCILVTAQ